MSSKHRFPTTCCSNCGMNRRSFLAQTSGASVLVPVAAAARIGTQAQERPNRLLPVRKALRVQPVFIYSEKTPKDATSWRWSAEICDEKSAAEEKTRINQDLKVLEKQADFPLEFLPLLSVKSQEQVGAVSGQQYDAMILYAAARSPEIMESLAKEDKWNIAFVRHRSGPIYYMYIGIHGHFLRKRTCRWS